MSKSLLALDPDVAAKATQLFKLANQKGIELVVTATYRSFGDQVVLYNQGRTTPGPIVTYAPAGWSLHNHRRAFDVAIKNFVGDETPENYFDGPWGVIGRMGEALGLEWGGRWHHADRPHFQDALGKTIAWWAQQPETAGLA